MLGEYSPARKGDHRRKSELAVASGPTHRYTPYTLAAKTSSFTGAAVTLHFLTSVTYWPYGSL